MSSVREIWTRMTNFFQITQEDRSILDQILSHSLKNVRFSSLLYSSLLLSNLTRSLHFYNWWLWNGRCLSWMHAYRHVAFLLFPVALIASLITFLPQPNPLYSLDRLRSTLDKFPSAFRRASCMHVSVSFAAVHWGTRMRMENSICPSSSISHDYASPL